MLTIVMLSAATFVSTLCGGFFAIKYKDKLHHIMAFAAGVLLGVVAFDILQEIMEQLEIHNFSSTGVMIALVTGFLLFHILEKSILIQHCYDEECAMHHKHPHIGFASALGIIGHSFLDGIGIGLGFQINVATGIAISIAVISHAFTDGLNDATLMLTHRNTERKTRIILFFHAIAPILGAIATLFFNLPSQFLVLYLGFFAGFIIYIGASNILPEAHSKQSSYGLISLTVLGALFIFLVTRLI